MVNRWRAGGGTAPANRRRAFRERRRGPWLTWAALRLAMGMACFPAASAAAVTGQVVLVRDGVSASTILLPANPHPDEVLAARELADHLQRMSGARLTTVRGGEAAGGVPIRVGLSLSPGAAARIGAVSDDPGAFFLSVEADGVRLAGLTPAGTLFAAYALLERLGCRWYMPGELGTVVPRRDDVELAAGTEVQAPSFAHRHLQAVPRSLPWYRRQRLGGDVFPSAHGIPLEPPADFATEPELFALVDGERRPRQLCIGNPEVLRRAIAAANQYFTQHPEAPWIGMGPNDGGGFCQDEKCTRLDGGQWDPFAAEESMTDRYVWFFNQVLAGLDARWADKKIGFYAYAAYKLPPVRWQPDPRLVPALAPITLCRIHGMDNPVCPERSFYRQLMRGWGQVVPQVFERGYYFNLADPGLPFSKVHAIRDETPAALDLGVVGWRVETMPSWAVHTPTLYVAARLMWDAHADVDALLDDFYTGFFGPAAAPMRRYLEAVDTALRDGDCHTGGSHCLRRIFSDGDLANFARDFDEAERLAGMEGVAQEPASGSLSAGAGLDDGGGSAARAARAARPPYAERVRVFRMGFERLRLFRRMLDARDDFDFASAEGTMRDLLALTDTMRATALAEGAYLLDPRSARVYLERFWSPAVRAGYRATVTRGRLVATLPERWDFLVDPEGVGETLGYFRPDLRGGNWQLLHTSSRSWGEQGLRYYKGTAWYRARVELPGAVLGDSLFVQFGGVDEKARVWLNGQLLGAAQAGAFEPFDLEATAAARAGANVLAVEITNERLDELGTGGITAPVFVWTPR